MSQNQNQREMEEAFYRAMQRSKPGVGSQVLRGVLFVLVVLGALAVIGLLMQQ